MIKKYKTALSVLERRLYGAFVTHAYEFSRQRNALKKLPKFPRDTIPDRAKKHLRTAAKLVVLHKLDPHFYVHCCFQEAASEQKSVICDFYLLVKPGALDRYNAAYQDHVSDLANQLRHQAKVFDAERLLYQRLSLIQADGDLDKARLVALHILRDSQISQDDMSPLFRYCIAAQYGLSNCMEKLNEAAVRQYSLFPAGYRQAWKTFLPTVFLMRAERAATACLN